LVRNVQQNSNKKTEHQCYYEKNKFKAITMIDTKVNLGWE